MGDLAAHETPLPLWKRARHHVVADHPPAPITLPSHSQPPARDRTEQTTVRDQSEPPLGITRWAQGARKLQDLRPDLRCQRDTVIHTPCPEERLRKRLITPALQCAP